MDSGSWPPWAPVALILGLGGFWHWRARKARRTAAARWSAGRPRMGDAEFLAACEIPDDPFRMEMALAARRAIARLGTVPPEAIGPDDKFDGDLDVLPYWDSLDWLGFIFEVERELGGRIKLPKGAVAGGLPGGDFGGRGGPLRVKEVARASALAAINPGHRAPG